MESNRFLKNRKEWLKKNGDFKYWEFIGGRTMTKLKGIDEHGNEYDITRKFEKDNNLLYFKERIGYYCPKIKHLWEELLPALTSTCEICKYPKIKNQSYIMKIPKYPNKLGTIMTVGSSCINLIKHRKCMRCNKKHNGKVDKNGNLNTICVDCKREMKKNKNKKKCEECGKVHKNRKYNLCNDCGKERCYSCGKQFYIMDGHDCYF